MNIKTGDCITWKCAAGNLTGTVANIVLADNAENKTVPWLVVTSIVDFHGKKVGNTRLCGTDINLAMLQVRTVDDCPTWIKDLLPASECV